MNILFVTSEVAGVYKIGGLADVSQSLPKALGVLGHHVDILLPYYSEVSPDHVSLKTSIDIQYAGKLERVDVYEKHTGDAGVQLLLLKHPLLDQYHTDHTLESFMFFSFVATSLCIDSKRYLDRQVDLVHCHDWHTALVPVLLGKTYREHGLLELRTENYDDVQIPTVLTIHNLMYTGVVPMSSIERLNVPGSILHGVNSNIGISVSLLREGLEQATRVTTVSPTYANEITVEQSLPIGDVLIRRKSDVSGILNGIDTDIWNPQTDTKLQKNYDANSVESSKKLNKIHLQMSYQLSTKDSFLLGFVGRIEPHQKGIDLVISSLSTLLINNNIQVIILGTGDKITEDILKNFASGFSKQVLFLNMFDDKIAHQIYAGCDALLVPSKFEPCGLTQLIAMRYGTLPIVRKTGGLADSVSDLQTGFVFEDYSSEHLNAKIIQAYHMWESDQTTWMQMVSRAMSSDFSWTKSAKEYEKVYTSLVQPDDVV